MARIFLTTDEAIDWGLVKPKTFNFTKMKEKVLIRVLAGVIVALLILLIGVSGPTMSALITSVTG